MGVECWEPVAGSHGRGDYGCTGSRLSFVRIGYGLSGRPGAAPHGRRPPAATTSGSPNSVWGKRPWRTTIDSGALQVRRYARVGWIFMNARVDSLLIEALELPTDERCALVVALLANEAL